VGSSGIYSMSGSSSHEASLQIQLKPLDERQFTTTETAEQIRGLLARVPGAEITVSAAEMMTGSSALEVSVRGDDLTILEQLGDQILNIFEGTEGVRNAKNSLAVGNNELQLIVDRESLARYGLTAGQVLTAVRNSYDGQVISRMRTGENEVDIRLETANNAEATVDSLANLTIVSPTGARVPVSAVARIENNKSPQQIVRYAQSREVRITADIAGRDLGSINNEINAKLAQLKMPEGYLLDMGGQTEDMMESFGSLIMALLLSILLVYMFLVAQFESLFQPFIIMFALPPTFIGVVIGLGLTGHHLSVPALIGAIMLVGIVLNNSIVLVDYVNNLRKRGYELREAILEAGPIRLRPILMTALTTILAILPLAFGVGEGAELRAPMAIVVAFGLAFSTLITLVLVPVVYSIFDEWGKKISLRFTRKSDEQAVTEA
jgi:HAE1 family hydrophobic/amphiphilic exporter-1